MKCLSRRPSDKSPVQSIRQKTLDFRFGMPPALGNTVLDMKNTDPIAMPLALGRQKLQEPLHPTQSFDRTSCQYKDLFCQCSSLGELVGRGRSRAAVPNS